MPEQLIVNGFSRVRFQPQIHRRCETLLVPVNVGGAVELMSTLNTNRPYSVISRTSFTQIPSEFVRFGRENYRDVTLSSLEIEGQPCPPIEFRISDVVARLGYQAMLGLNFLYLFREVHFDRDSFRMTLTP